MEDFSKPVRTYRGRGRGTYVPRTVFNPAADVLAGIEYVEGTFKERRDKVNLFQQQAEQRRIDMQKLVNDTQRIDQTDTMAKMTDQFSNMVTDIYKADIASFDGDRSDYLNKANNAQKVIGDFGKVIGTVNELSNKYLDMNPAEQKKMVLRNQFLGKDGDKRKAYMEFLNDPSKMNIRIQGEDIIITNNGQDLFNGTQLLNSVKDGSSLLEYADDYTEQIGAASKDAMSGIKNLVVAKQYEGMSDDGSRVYTTAKNDYLGAVDQYKKNLENSDKVDALLNESTFQRYIDGDENYNSQKHDAATKEAIIEQLIIKEFPMYKEELKKGKLVRSAIGNKKISSKPGKQMSELDRQKLILEQQKLNLQREKQKQESKALGAPIKYVDNLYTELETALRPGAGGEINKDAVKKIITTQVSSVPGLDPKSLNFDGDRLTIVTEKSTGEKAYTAEQTKLINDSAGTILIGKNGQVIDEDAFKTYKEDNIVGKPEGKPIEKPGKTIVIDDYTSAQGIAEISNLLVRNKYTTESKRNQALDEVQRLMKTTLQEQSTIDAAEQAKLVRSSNAEAIRKDAAVYKNVTKKVDFNNPSSQSKKAIDFFKSVAAYDPNFKIKTAEQTDGTPIYTSVEDYLKQGPISLEDLYYNYADAYEQISKIPNIGESKVLLTYDALDINSNKKTAYTKKS